MQMRIASSGRNPSDKEQHSRSDHNEIGSIDNGSFDPDQEPRKEGSPKIRINASIGEQLPDLSAMSDGASIGHNNLNRKGSVKSPNRAMQNITDNDDDDYHQLNTNPSKGNLSTNRKIVPKYMGN
jgi:hypothetical protein